MPPTVFISYSHEDEDWKDLLVTHLAGLERAGRLRVWEDRAIHAGQVWRQEIETAMEEARVAVLLVSPNFLASDFIQAQELPLLLKRRMEGGMHIVPVIVRDCLWEEEVRIANLQARPRDGRALASFRSDRRDTELKKIAKEILELLDEGGSPVQVFQIGQVLEPEGRPAGKDSNPYKGLAAFREEDADLFFGREKLTEELWEKLQALQETRGTEGAVRLLAVVGPSGSGKSSLVRAGLLPELARRPLAGLENLRVAIVTPGAHPVEALALVLARLVTGDSDPVTKARELSEELIQRNPAGKLDGLRRIAGDKPLLVFVDQFEEAYTLAAAEERAVFVANLLEAAAVRGGTALVLLGLRDDFMGDTRRDEALHQIVARQNLFARYLGEDELRRAIAEPARRAGRPLDEGTIGHLVEATQNEEQALPALQFTLSQIWEGMVNGVSPARTYEIIGGIAGSFAKEAQRLYDALPETDGRIARRAFLRMVRVGPDIPDTARKVDLDEVVAWDEDRDHVKAVLERFARPEARIITLAAEPDNRTTTRLTHEALLLRWSQLDLWLTPQAREDLIFHYGLEERARYWNRLGRPADQLWPRRDLERLRAYEQRAGREMTAVQREYFAASTRRVRLGRILRDRRVAYAATAALALALGLFGWKLYLVSLDEQLPPNVSSGVDSTHPITPEHDNRGATEPFQGQPAAAFASGLQQQIRQLVGVGSLNMRSPVQIAIVGALPTTDLPGAQGIKVLDVPVPEASFRSEQEDTGWLTELVRMAAPKAEFLFVPVASRRDTDFQEAYERLLATTPLPPITLCRFGRLNMEIKGVERFAEHGSMIVLPAGNSSTGEVLLASSPARKGVLVISAVDLKGLRPSFTSLDPETLWAPGESIPFRHSIKRGTSFAAAIATGLVARLVADYPKLSPAEAISVLRRTSRRVSSEGPPVLNLDAALAELAKNPPQGLLLPPKPGALNR